MRYPLSYGTTVFVLMANSHVNTSAYKPKVPGHVGVRHMKVAWSNFNSCKYRDTQTVLPDL